MIIRPGQGTEIVQSVMPGPATSSAERRCDLSNVLPLSDLNCSLAIKKQTVHP